MHLISIRSWFFALTMEPFSSEWYRKRQCYVCSETFTSVATLEAHLLYKHNYYGNLSTNIMSGGSIGEFGDSTEDVDFERTEFLEGVTAEYFADLDHLNLKQPEDVFSYIYSQLSSMLHRELQTRKAFKVIFVMETLFSKINPDTLEKEFTDPTAYPKLLPFDS